MFNVEENVFSHKNAISKTTWKKSSYLPKVGSMLTYVFKLKRIRYKVSSIKPQSIDFINLQKSMYPTFRSIFSKINIFPDSVFETNQINLDF
ncbi:predicted protein [Methanosarcina acetivorans C2A]|uniref:Uncharacterized protein n=1 Tax=Methanosarcina acetivorans (strain ATCC 35395 / DSM 2834 / JCM 12185 / C2A) TaxID=188937 RepID=Q8THR9_METAC|nr:predicted protein [Methanosarcina acetivorans C2A]